MIENPLYTQFLLNKDFNEQLEEDWQAYKKRSNADDDVKIHFAEGWMKVAFEYYESRFNGPNPRGD